MYLVVKIYTVQTLLWKNKYDDFCSHQRFFQQFVLLKTPCVVNLRPIIHNKLITEQFRDQKYLVYYASFVDILCVFLSCVSYAFVSVCLYVPCGHLLGKDWPLGSRLWCPAMSLSLSHWYPGSGEVLDCIDS